MQDAVVRWFSQHPAAKVYCEVPFNVYGQRGIVDVVALAKLSPTNEQWRGAACELKPNIVNFGETLRQVRKAETYFQLPPQMSSRYQTPILQFPLLVGANEHNFDLAQRYRALLRGVDLHFFDNEYALANDFEKEWKASKKAENN